MGAHVSVCPNHSVGRVTPFETRGDVALVGTFGYDLDITKLSQEEKELVKGQVEKYNKYNFLMREEINAVYESLKQEKVELQKQTAEIEENSASIQMELETSAEQEKKLEESFKPNQEILE